MRKKVMRGAGVVRLLLTGVLLVLVFRETGPWTAVTLALVMFGSEAQLWLLKRIER